MVASVINALGELLEKNKAVDRFFALCFGIDEREEKYHLRKSISKLVKTAQRIRAYSSASVRSYSNVRKRESSFVTPTSTNYNIRVTDKRLKTTSVQKDIVEGRHQLMCERACCDGNENDLLAAREEREDKIVVTEGIQ